MLQTDRLTNSAHDINKGQSWPLPLVHTYNTKLSRHYIITINKLWIKKK